MSKVSGGTRTSGPSQGWQPNAYEAASSAMLENMRDILNKKGDADFDSEQWRVWNAMTTAERELMLMESGFTGMVYDDGDTLNVIQKNTLKDILSCAEEALVNDWEGYNGTEDNTFTIGYKDGSTKELGAFGDVFERPANFDRLSSRGKYAAARKAIGNTRNISFVINQNASNSMYAHDAKNGNTQLKKYTDWEEWKRGRGEKRRSYIQDDWV